MSPRHHRIIVINYDKIDTIIRILIIIFMIVFMIVLMLVI